MVWDSNRIELWAREACPFVLFLHFSAVQCNTIHET